MWEYERELDYSLLFRESFCVAASDLAQELQVPIQNLGVLYDDIMMTGTTSLEARAKRTLRSSSRHDLEAGRTITFGRGQLLFVVRHASKPEVSRLTNAGYRFATMSQVGEIIARSMQVPISQLAVHVNRLREHRRSHDIEYGSQFLACYALRSKAAQKGFDVLVPRAMPSHLPKIALPFSQLQPWQEAIFARLEGRSVRECLQWLNSKSKEDLQAIEEEDFKDLMYNRISTLTQVVGEPWFYQAVFCSKPFTANFTDTSDDSTSQMTIYAFCIIPDVHTCSLKPMSDMIYTPLSFFKTRQRVYNGSPDHSVLARQIHREFAPIILQMQRERRTRPVASRSQSKSLSHLWSGGPGNDATVKSDSCSERELVKSPGDHTIEEVEQPTTPKTTKFSFGGILVSSDTTIDTTRSDPILEMQDMGTTAIVSAEKSEKEAPTFVDHLYNVTSSRFGHNVSSRTGTKAS